jgi:uncharacterized protein (TIGR00106 family)
MIIADFAVIPMGRGTSASDYVRAVHEMLRESGIKHVAGPMSTTIEAQGFDDLSLVIENANKILAEMGVKRIITTLRIDYRLDKEISIESKLQKM